MPPSARRLHHRSARSGGFADRRQDSRRARRAGRERGRSHDAAAQPQPALRPAGATPAIKAGDILLLEGEPDVLERIVGGGQAQAGARRDRSSRSTRRRDDIGVMEAVVTANSLLVDRTPAQLRLHERYRVNLLAVSRRGERDHAAACVRSGSSRATSWCCRATSTPCRRRSASCAACRWPPAICGSEAAAAAFFRCSCWSLPWFW